MEAYLEVICSNTTQRTVVLFEHLCGVELFVKQRLKIFMLKFTTRIMRCFKESCSKETVLCSQQEEPQTISRQY